MKLLQELDADLEAIQLVEKLRANWDMEKIGALKPKQLKALMKNAENAGDDKVLGMCKQTVIDQVAVEKKIAGS